MKVERKRVLGIAVLLLPLLGIPILKGQEENTFGWVVRPTNPPAVARDNSSIKISGSGTFVVGNPEEVTGGGIWQTFDKDGNSTGSGNFQVTGLVKFDPAPGFIATQPELRAGLAFLRIAYDDGTLGILVVSCNLGPTSPPQVAEGFSASNGFTNYWRGFSGPAFFTVGGATED